MPLSAEERRARRRLQSEAEEERLAKERLRPQKRAEDRKKADRRDQQARSRKRVQEGTKADRRDQKARSRKRVQEGTKADRRDELARSRKRVRDGTKADRRDQLARSRKRVQDGTKADRRDQQARSRKRLQEGTKADHRDELARSRRRVQDGPRADRRDQQARSRKRLQEGTKADRRDQLARSRKRVQDGAKADRRDQQARSRKRLREGTKADRRDQQKKSRAHRASSKNQSRRKKASADAIFGEAAEQAPGAAGGNAGELIDWEEDIVEAMDTNCVTCGVAKLLTTIKFVGPQCTTRRSSQGEMAFFHERVRRPTPEPLRRLTTIEEMAIPIALPLISVCRLKGGQYGYRNHTTVIPQNLTNFVSRLPRYLAALAQSCVATIRQSTKGEIGLGEHRDFEFRPAFVKAALGWLKANNPNYSAVEIEADSAIDSFAGFHYGKETIDVELDAAENAPKNAEVKDADGEADGRNATERKADIFSQSCLSNGDCFFDAWRKATGRGSVKSLRNMLSDRCDEATLHMYKGRLREATCVREVARSAFDAVQLDGLRRARGGSAKGKRKLSKSDYRELLGLGPDFANAVQEAEDGLSAAEDVYSDIR